MIKIRDILGLPVIYDDGSKSPGFLKDVIIDTCEKQVKAFIVEKRGIRNMITVFDFDDILDIGGGALIVKKCSDTKKYGEQENFDNKEHKKEISRSNSLEKKFSDIDKKKCEIKVYSKNGDDLGIVKDIFFNEQTGKIEAFELSDGLIDDIIGGRKLIPLIGKYEFGEENIVVGIDSVQEMISSRENRKKEKHIS